MIVSDHALISFSMTLNYNEIRKKGFLFAPIIGLIFLVHLIGVYVYEGGVSMGVSGGSINIGLVGEAPAIPNPIDYTKNKYHDLILKFLFRSLITYDAKKGEYQGDIGTCDIRDLSKIVCELKKNQYWSDGTPIQVEDVIATYQAFRANADTSKMGVFLKSVSFVSSDSGKITITAKEKNSLILDFLMYPIVRSDMLERIKTGRIGQEGYITSGSYKFSEKKKDTEHGYDRVTIERDEKNGGEGWLDKYHFLFFPDLASLERSTDNLSIIIPPVKSEKILLGPRFDPYVYAMYEYIGLFANTDTLSTEMRRQLYGKIAESFSGKIDSSERPVQNIFSLQTGTTSPIKLEKNLSDVMRALGYTKPDTQIAALNQQTGFLTGASIDYGNTKYFTAPTNKKIYFSEVATGEFLLSGKIPSTTKNVYINNYQLREYSEGSTSFNYRVSLERKNLIEGKNEYILELGDGDGNRTAQDSLTIYFSRDSQVLNSMKEKVDNEYLAVLNSSDKVAARQQAIETERTRLKSLDPRYYYNKKGEPFEVKIAYKDDPLSLQTYAGYVSTALQDLSIKSTLVPLSTKDIQSMLSSGKKDYDFIIIPFEASGRLSRIGQVFLSSEAKNGINFAKIESKTLDSLFAELRVASIREETEKIEQKILDYMQSEGFFLSLSSPLHTLYIDKNLKGVKYIDTFQDISTLHTVLATASIKDTYLIQTEGKSISNFIVWVFHKAFSN
ncbi:MAG: ABC transporter substrate-binding protein [Candidatus Gracilibacteria bacterium]|nr:ABC transporter substrate-binding protein [Candidatus Gracilibacteria bacterium]